MKIIFIALAITLLIGCASTQLDQGVNLYNQGQYDQAAAKWNPLARAGDPIAQYNLGLLWERGLGSRTLNKDMAASWYSRSANQGNVPAMLALARVQLQSGYQEQAYSWLTQAARWGNQAATKQLTQAGRPVPPADLLQQANYRQQVYDQQMAETYQNLGYSLGCALAGGCQSTQTQSSYQNTPVQPQFVAPSNNLGQNFNSNTESSNTRKTCSSDFSCGIGSKCVKQQFRGQGVCMGNLDEYGLPAYDMPDLDSVGPNMKLKPACRFNTDCPIGFKCDQSYKVCVK